jgi:acetyl esterase/lipase
VFKWVSHWIPLRLPLPSYAFLASTFYVPVFDAERRLTIQQCKKTAKTLNIDPTRIVVAGGSAGGNLAAVLTQMARDNGESGIIGQVLNIPVTCHPDCFPKDKFEYNSWVQNKHASILGEAEMRKCWNAYITSNVDNVYASPLLAKTFEGLPPARMSEIFFAFA